MGSGVGPVRCRLGVSEGRDLAEDAMVLEGSESIANRLILVNCEEKIETRT